MSLSPPQEDKNQLEFIYSALISYSVIKRQQHLIKIKAEDVGGKQAERNIIIIFNISF